jgi:hypothetical protein
MTWLLFAISAGLFGALVYYAQVTPANQVPSAERQPQKASEVTVFTPSFENGDWSYDSKKEPVPAGSDAVLYAVNRALVASKVAPADARAIGVRIEGGTAVIDFNGAFDRTYGTEDERTLLETIFKSLGQFRSLRQASFTIEGTPVETLGNIDLTSPQPVLRPGQSASEPAPAQP